MLGIIALGVVKRQSKAASWALLGCSNASPQCALHSHATPNPMGGPGFVFDIDGVLTRGRSVLEPAKKAFEKLTTAQGWKYPVCFLTNGGGVTEAQKAAELSDWLNVPASEDQVILSHTPMRSLVPALQNQPVLICGRGSVLDVAKYYGFKRCMTVEQLAHAMPNAVPFAQLPGSAEMRNKDGPAQELPTEENPIKAVLVLTDPRNWYVDLQIILDVLMSGGVPTRSPTESGSVTSPVDLYFSNPDLLWANDFPRNRLGQGAFAHVLLSMYNELAEGRKPDFLVKWFGKPNPEPYLLAGKSLLNQAAQMGGVIPSNSNWTSGSHTHDLAAVFSGIYCVGDNPCADIRGANRAGPPFTSVLVKTGVFKGPGNCPRDPAMICVQDVLGAVEAALHKTRSLRFHSMR
ncbi:HAD-like domain-containing protein [Dunaliella salina]|uniref:HAD-like domain-containing protein n=1 Tax=Dunaliella salina TaxID=3046 RepID=A0ABQ7GID7_DUNSA|nr:HAD-like domain-containing protein [Dunaliella salina]|eukprot:KAF5834329.1 HAD-like domain-containing protein [Dunaliella salina]